MWTIKLKTPYFSAHDTSLYIYEAPPHFSNSSIQGKLAPPLARKNPSALSSMDPLPVLRAFHEIERRVFLRLLNLGSDPYVAKKIIAFWLWMECICHSQLVLRIRELSNKDLRVVSREAEGALACVENSAERPPLGNGLSITSELLNLPVVMRFFHVHQETAMREISFFLDGVCSVVFEDIIEKRATRNAAGRWYLILF